MYREQFPALTISSNNAESLVYLDSAATSQKPQAVLDALALYHLKPNANVHRGVSSLTGEATHEYELARKTIQEFIHAETEKQIIWTRGTTESINLIAQTYARSTLQKNDEILVGEMEHHSNLIPWLIVAEQTGAKVVKVPMTSDCQWDINAYQSLLSNKTKIVAAAHVTNVTGTRQPIEKIIELAHQHHAICVIDGAQGIVHEEVDVQALDCDFYAFSGHKLYADTGIGVLYGKQKLLDTMPAWHGGGKMINSVSFNHIEYAPIPAKFEAGTPNISGAISLASAINWLSQFDRKQTHQHTTQLQKSLITQLNQIDEVQLIGVQAESSMVNFIVKIDDEIIHHQDIATLLSEQNIIVRSGHHCAHPLMDALGIKGTVRVSFGVYNNEQDIERFVVALKKSISLL